MAERTEREALHHLIDICRDGERGFRAAAEAVSDPRLKTLFKELAAERAKFAADLVPHLQRLRLTNHSNLRLSRSRPDQR